MRGHHRALALALGMFYAFTVSAASYYVDDDAAGGGDGSLGTPWNAISQVNSATFVAGDIVHFQCGDDWRETLTIGESGSAGNPITFAFGDYGTCTGSNNAQIIGSDLIAEMDWTEEVGPPLNTTYMDNVEGVQTSNLIAYFPLWDDVGATSVEDRGPNSLSASTGNVTFGVTGAGDGSTGAQFDGTGNEYVDFYSTAFQTLFNGLEGSILTWVKIDSATWTDATLRYIWRIVGTGGAGNNEIFLNRFSTNNQLQVRYQAGGTNDSFAAAPTGPPTGWVPIVVTWSKTNDRVRLYVSGSIVGTPAGTLGTWNATGLNGVIVLIGGNQSNNTTNRYDGDIAHFAVWDVELTGAEVTTVSTMVAGGGGTGDGIYSATITDAPFFPAIFDAADNYGYYKAPDEATLYTTPGSFWVNGGETEVWVHTRDAMAPGDHEFSRRAPISGTTVSNILIDGLVSNYGHPGAFLGENSTDVEIRNSEFNYAAYYGIEAWGTTFWIHHNTFTKNGPNGGGGITGDPLNDTIIEWNSFDRNGGHHLGPTYSFSWGGGPQLAVDSHDSIFRYNFAIGYNLGIADPLDRIIGDVCLNFEGDGLDDNQAYHNICLGFTYCGIASDSTDSAFYNNTCTLVDAGSRNDSNGPFVACLQALGTSTGTIFKNNLCAWPEMTYDNPAGVFQVWISAASKTGSDIDFNCFQTIPGVSTPFFWDPTAYNLADWRTNSMQDANSVEDSDLELVDGLGDTADDMKLPGTSPCVDEGMNSGLTPDYFGMPRPRNSVFDIGAFEFPAGSPVPAIVQQMN